MSGAGPVVYGLFDDKELAARRCDGTWAASGRPGSAVRRGTVDRLWRSRPNRKRRFSRRQRLSRRASRGPTAARGCSSGTRRPRSRSAIAAAEALIVWIKSDFTTWTVVIISIPIILFYLLAGRTLESSTWRDISWVAATAQALAVVGVILLEILPVADADPGGDLRRGRAAAAALGPPPTRLEVADLYSASGGA